MSNVIIIYKSGEQTKQSTYYENMANQIAEEMGDDLYGTVTLWKPGDKVDYRI